MVGLCFLLQRRAASGWELLHYYPLSCAQRSSSLSHHEVVPASTLLQGRTTWDQTAGELVVTCSVPLSPSDVVLGCSGHPVSDRWLSQPREREL